MAGGFHSEVKTQLSLEEGIHTCSSSRQAGEDLITELAATMTGSGTSSGPQFDTCPAEPPLAKIS